MSSRARSAGLLPFRRRAGRIEVFLVHPGGPFFARRDAGAWSLAKGELEPGEEDVLAAARREFEEETSFVAEGDFLPLGEVRLKSGKTVVAFGFEGCFDPADLRSNEFELEWPPMSGRTQRFPEVDRGAWFALEEARARLNPAQVELLQRLEDALG